MENVRRFTKKLLQKQGDLETALKHLRSYNLPKEELRVVKRKLKKYADD